MNDKQVKQWLKERDEAILSLDLNKYKAFYLKWKKNGFYDAPLPNDEVVEISMYKCVCSLANPPKDKLEKAKAWLKERGYSCGIWEVQNERR